ncbi:MAG: hypothetical protein KJ598_05445, partial [Nanoarchaeota archaeon]|nr:hypothetical protein [Nanoarchaeota archaeon]
MKKKRPDRGNFKVLTSTKSEAFLKRKSKKPTKKSVKMLAKKVKLGKEGKSPGNAPEKIIQKKAAKRAKITKRVKKSGRAKAIKRAEGASKNKKIIK